jgi:hypothetical protein
VESIPVLTLCYGCLQGWLHGRGGLEVAALGGGGALVFKREGGLVVAVRGEPGSCRPLFIGTERRFRRPIFRARGAPAAGNGGSGKVPAWTRPTGFAVRQALWTRPVVQGAS